MGDMPAWWNPAADKRRQNRRSRSQERRRAKETGGKVQSGSGSSWRARGDVKNSEALEELKFTDKNSFTIKVKDWEIWRDRALKQGRNPKLVIDFEGAGLRLVVTEE